MLTPKGRAQQRRCIAEKCENWIVCFGEAAVRNSKWADFCRYQGNEPENWMHLTATTWEVGECPAGYWADLEPITKEEANKTVDEVIVSRQVSSLLPAFSSIFSNMNQTNVQDHLTQLVVNGIIRQETKELLEVELFPIEQIL